METLEPLATSRAAIDESFAELAGVGTWWTGAERLAMLEEARAARDCALCATRRAALSPYSVPDSHAASGALSAAARDAVHRLMTDPGRVTERFVTELVASGLEPEAVVELVGVVSTLCLADTFQLAIGEDALPLPAAGEGRPSRARPPGLETSCAWLPTVDPEAAEGTIKLMYDMVQGDAGFVFHVARALTAVPDTLQSFFRSFSTNYHTHGATKGKLSRPQVELLASSTSAINECFY